MIMKMRGDKCHLGRGKRVKIPLLPNNVGKKSAKNRVTTETIMYAVLYAPKEKFAQYITQYLLEQEC